MQKRACHDLENLFLNQLVYIKTISELSIQPILRKTFLSVRIKVKKCVLRRTTLKIQNYFVYLFVYSIARIKTLMQKKKNS